MFHICCLNTNIGDTVCITISVVFQAFTAHIDKMMVFWVLTPCRTVY